MGTKYCETGFNFKIKMWIIRVQRSTKAHSFTIYPDFTKKIKHIEFRLGILQQTFDLLAEEIKHNTEDWKDSVLALDEMSIESEEMFDPSTNEFIGKTILVSHSGVANKVLVFLLGYYCSMKTSGLFSPNWL